MSIEHMEDRRMPWIREWELWILILMVVGLYFSQLDTLSVRGEESRRGSVAQEMMRTGDFVVPRLQGDAYFMSSRPPLQAWTIAGIGWLRGQVDMFAVQLPSGIAVLLTVVVVYGYSRTFLSRLGAFSAGAAFATMLQVLELGRLGETDALFTLFVSSSLLVWHAGYLRNWNPAWTWGLGYLFAALATLTKGPQGPVYFGAPVGLFLLLQRDWRFAFSYAHLFGMTIFLAVWGSWQWAFFLQEGVEGVRHIYFGDVAMYGDDRSIGAYAAHLTRYPLEILGCLLPWSLCLLMWFRSESRQRIGSARVPLMFLLTAIAVTFPSVWFVTGARSRFFMSLYPCFAVLCGIILERCFEADAGSALRRDWNRCLSALSVVMPLTGLVIFGVTIVQEDGIDLGQPLWFAVAFVIATMFLAKGALHAARTDTTRAQLLGVLSVAVFTGLMVSGVHGNALRADNVPKAAQVELVKQLLPAGQQLYSLGDVDHGFSFHFAQPIEKLEYADLAKGLPAGVDYFCFEMHDPELDENLGFPWRPVAVVSCARNREKEWSKFVVVGRRSHTGPVRPTDELVNHFFHSTLPLTAETIARGARNAAQN